MSARRPFAMALAVAGYIVMIVPIFFVVATSFTAGQILTFPPQGFSLRWFQAAAEYPPFRDSMVSSFVLAVVATAIALALGVPVALALYRGRPRGRGVIEALFLSPLIVPELVVGLALYQQVVVQLGQASMIALVVGHAVLLLPYAVRVTGASLAMADPMIEEAARGLGASPMYTFWTITLPLLRPGIVSAAILGFVTSFNNVPLSLLLQSPEFSTLPVELLNYVQQNYTPIVAAASTLILAGTVLIAALAERLVGFTAIFGGISR